eukprot:SAG22_NODE_18509_length_286_cov_0.823529_2_plen_30_part_01
MRAAAIVEHKAKGAAARAIVEEHFENILEL